MKPSINRSQVSSTDANYLKDQNDRVCIEMKGRLFSIPRHDYDRLIAEQANDKPEDRIRLIHAGPKKKPPSTLHGEITTLEASTTGAHCSERSEASLSSHRPAPTESDRTITKPENNAKPSTEQLFSRTSSGFTLSKEAIIEKPVDKNSPKRSFVKFKNNLYLGTTESDNSLTPKSPVEMTKKLFQLRSSVVNTIDQFIDQIETDHDYGNSAAGEEKKHPLHPSGDGSTLDYRKENLQLLNTESFARNIREIRTKLYREIGTLVNRLKDLDSLE
ncbi:uncharacterized protein LOC115259815 [Aedes albopictus]|uniref:Uncharacterized protein n=1 Tax=Aedes albopictus TaxID=7160 RepID=A0ABM1Z1U7_AEDAL